MKHQFFATAPLGFELLLADELNALNLSDVAFAKSGVSFSGRLADAYKACLWSRLANRILLRLESFQAVTPEELYAGVSKIDWSEHLEADAALAIDFVSLRSQINHTQFGAQKVKDAIVDQFRNRFGTRPSVRLDWPDVRINVFLDKDIASLSLDLSGESLHRRGYRKEAGGAPLKENLAAAILLRAGWPKIAEANGDLIDPMCGSGTLLIEAAWMAADIAPGLMRDYFGFTGWKKHDELAWKGLIEEAHARREAGLKKLNLSIRGFDIDRFAVQIASGNVSRAGLSDFISIENKSAIDVRPVHEFGLVVANPPYGMRLGETKQLVALYTEFGETLKNHFQGYKASVITSDPELSFKLGLRQQKSYKLYNGALECKLYNFEIIPSLFFTPRPDESDLSEEQRKIGQLMRKAHSLAQKPDAGAEMFANRLHKNLKNLGKWAKQNQISCYRLYDADLPEYALAIDLYQGDHTWLHVQEYQAPSSIDPEKAEARLTQALSVLPSVLEMPEKNIFLKVRRKQKGVNQYEKQAESGHFHLITEGGCKLWVNFEDYLDTGLFLDHRSTRMMIQSMAEDKSFLNLFAYTGSASVHAAVGGARTTTSVDMSNTYLDWARRNFEANQIKGYQHDLIQADCLAWLEDEAQKGEQQFDLIFLDPPTFSNSKRMQDAFDIQHDHVQLLKDAASLLSDEGILIFSTNFRRFKLDADALSGLKIKDLSAKTLPKDFARNPKIHYCWQIENS